MARSRLTGQGSSCVLVGGRGRPLTWLPVRPRALALLPGHCLSRGERRATGSACARRGRRW
eukprot:3949501-Alexandrium_andersonii.AAC.1